jgi:AcrR family transcriptional regulator
MSTMRTAAVQADLREVILDAMERLLARYGYKKTTVDDLAREAGIGKGTVYLYFPSKEEVALCSIDRVVDRVKEKLLELANSSGDAAQRLREMLQARVLMRFDSVHAYSESLDDLFESLRPAYMARRHNYFESEANIFAKVLLEGRREKTFAFTGDARACAYTLLLATNSLLPYSLSPRELGKRPEIEEKITRLAELVLHGLVRRPNA